jgi:hypothetical protein
VNEHEFEPVRALPAELPAGERLLWQGTPRWQSLATNAFQVRKVAVYFLVLIAFEATASLAGGQPTGHVMAGSAWLAALAAAAVAVLALLAWLNARATVYSITTRRIVMRFGIALPMTVNVPFAVVESAALRAHADGTADLPVRLTRGSRVGYLITWPHVRPWHFSRPEPMLRAIADGEHVAALLSAGLAEATGGIRSTNEPAPEAAVPTGATAGLSAAA